MSGAELQRPLVVDLDGTLIKTDLLAETASAFLTRRPLEAFRLVGWLLRGKPEFKRRLAASSPLDVGSLPYNEDLLAWLRAERAAGRSLVLATASHHLLADQVAGHLRIFDLVLATQGALNLRAGAKRDALVDLFGSKGFDYVGNEACDLPVWRSAAAAHVVCRSPELPLALQGEGNLGRTVAAGSRSRVAALLAAMRPHQWLKNLLLFVPMLAAHGYDSASSLLQALVAFVAFGLAASSVYLLNDLADVQSDRHHARKRLRPFASGDLALLHGWLAWPLLLLAALALSLALLPAPFAGVLALYVGVSTTYSMWFKRVPVLDVLTLAGLYTLRIVAGAAAIAVPLSFWLLAFSMFFFLSLAFMKRYSELEAAREAAPTAALRGRGYAPTDLALVSSLGSSSGQVAVLVLALYIQDARTAALYAEPRFIWLACPLLLYWVSRAWMIAHRGQMHHDPILFALRDRVSWTIGALLMAVFVLARVSWW